jgi:hypothetical protein
VLILLMPAARFGPSWLEGGLGVYWMVAVFGPLLCCLFLLVWWVTASRATRRERWLGLLGVVVSLTVTLFLVHPSMRGPGTTYLTLPMGMIAFGLGVIVLRARRPAQRTAGALFLALLGFFFSLLLRNEGMSGDYELGTHWRWSPSPESQMLARRAWETAAQGSRPSAAGVALPDAEWPGFRGMDRAGRVRGPALSTNWAAQVPRLLWRIPVGPAWSSFVVAQDRLFTQEQRGTMETVVCYAADTGREIWSRSMETRFDDPLGGPGPRATPTLARGGLFVTGATGNFLRLNPATGEIVWQRDLKVAASRTAPMWGFSASPLVVDQVVIVYAGGSGDKGLLAFDLEKGSLRWSTACGNDSYSSPQWSTIAGEQVVLMLSNEGLLLVDPASGQTRLNYEWKFSNYRALQPDVVGGEIVLLPTAMNTGTRAIRITRSQGQLAAQELWTSRSLKPDFTDLVTYQGYAYGNEGGLLTCIDLKTGDRQWKGGRYGKGQLLLLETSGLLLVAAESGQVVLLRADPKEHVEVASFKALEGKTWNHPVVVGDRLYLRNSQEAACYQLPLVDAGPAANSPAGGGTAR